jgi:hypothetical protein
MGVGRLWPTLFHKKARRRVVRVTGHNETSVRRSPRNGNVIVETDLKQKGIKAYDPDADESGRGR